MFKIIRWKKYVIVAGCIAVIIVLIIGIWSSSQSNKTKPKFGIYLLSTKDISAEDALKIDLDIIKLEEEPIIGIKDILSYNWEEHTFLLNEKSKQRIINEVDLYGRPFVFIANNKRIYMGIFTADVSSISFSNPVIIINNDMCKIEPMYPAPDGVQEIDIRNNDYIKQALAKHDKF